MRLTIQQRKLLQRKREEWKANPGVFAKELFGDNLWERQIDVLTELFRNNRVTVKSGHGIGKSKLASIAVLLWLLVHDEAIVVTTAPSWRQVEQILWNEIHQLLGKSTEYLGKYRLSQTELHFKPKKFAIGISTDQSDRFQGLHAQNILVIVDEAAGVPEMIFDAIEGVLTSSNAHLLLIGNPTNTSGSFYKSFKSPLYHKMHISCLESPNVVHDAELIPGLVTYQWCEERKKEWGEDSPIYQSRVLGEFASEGDDVLIPLTWVERAVKRSYSFAKGTDWEGANKCIGIDVARFGVDTTVMTALVYPKVVKVVHMNGKKTTEVVGAALALSQETGIRNFAVDDSGLGGGVTDLLMEKGFNVYPVNFGSKPLRDTGRFRNLKTEMFWTLREEFRLDRLVIPESIPEYLEELPHLKYEMTSDSQIGIVSKKKMRSMGYDSPDFADSLAIALLGAMQLQDGNDELDEEWGSGEDTMVNDEGYS